MSVRTNFTAQYNALYCACGELDYKIGVIRLDLCLVGRLVAHDLAALVTAVDDDVAALRVGQGAYRAEYTATLVRSVAGVYINVHGAKAKWAMIARGVAEGQYLTATVLAYKAGVIFCKSLVFIFTVAKSISSW